MTLEELRDLVSWCLEVKPPKHVTASLAIHHVDGALLEEFVDAYPELILQKTGGPRTGRTAWVGPTQSGSAVGLFEAMPELEVSSW